MKFFVFAIATLAARAVATDLIGPRAEGVIGRDQQRYGDRVGLGDAGRNGSLGYGFAIGYV